MFLLDTNVISERLKPKPDAGVASWIDNISIEEQFISVLTLGEIRNGIERLDIGKRKLKLSAWLEKMVPDQFENRILSVDEEVADCWGVLISQHSQNQAIIDSLIAATAIVHNLQIVTRNAKHFVHYNVPIMNPWEHK